LQSAEPKAVVVVESGPAVGARLEVRAGEPLLIGRTQAAPANLGGDPTVSQQHARVSLSADGQTWVEDLGSRNGTWVNGVRITEPIVVRDGDVLTIGAARARVMSSGATDRSSARADDARSLAVGSRSPDMPYPRRWSNSVIGRAQRVNERLQVRRTAYMSHPGSMNLTPPTVTTVRFTILPLDGSAPTPVRLRGSFVDGFVNDGEIVEARGTWRRGEFRAVEVYSHSSGDTLRVKYRAVQFVIGLVALTLIAGVALWIVFGSSGVLRQDDQTPPTTSNFRQDFIEACVANGTPREQCAAHAPPP
jgi:pSer/pThr/pTyr-binding forkhead associated (FHA) protein